MARALQLAAGEPLGTGPGLVRETDPLEPPVGLLRADAVQGAEGADLLQGGEAFEECRRLQLDTDAWKQLGVAGPG